MRIIVLILLVTLLPLAAFSQVEIGAGSSSVPETPLPQPEQQVQKSTSDFSADDLNFDCKKCVDDEKSHECVYCDGVLTGAATVIGVYEYGRGFCPPNNLDTKMVRNTYRRWFLKNSGNPEIISMRAVPSVIQAMKDMFPCNSNKPTGR